MWKTNLKDVGLQSSPLSLLCWEQAHLIIQQINSIQRPFVLCQMLAVSLFSQFLAGILKYSAVRPLWATAHNWYSLFSAWLVTTWCRLAPIQFQSIDYYFPVQNVHIIWTPKHHVYFALDSFSSFCVVFFLVCMPPASWRGENGLEKKYFKLPLLKN